MNILPQIWISIFGFFSTTSIFMTFIKAGNIDGTIALVIFIMWSCTMGAGGALFWISVLTPPAKPAAEGALRQSEAHKSQSKGHPS